MNRHHRRFLCVTFAATIALTAATSDAQTPSGVPAAPPKYSPDVPAKITTPDTVKTRIRWVTDVGLTGPDKGAGGDCLFVPPGYQGTVPVTGYTIAKPRTIRLLIFYRVFIENGNLAAATASVKAKAALFPLSQAEKARRRASSTSRASASTPSAPMTSASTRS